MITIVMLSSGVGEAFDYKHLDICTSHPRPSGDNSLIVDEQILGIPHPLLHWELVVSHRSRKDDHFCFNVIHFKLVFEYPTPKYSML